MFHAETWFSDVVVCKRPCEALALPAAIQSRGLNRRERCHHGVLGDEEILSLLFIREEEKLALEVYLTLCASWGLRVFENVAASERTHIDAILQLLSRFHVPGPALSFGKFDNDGLQALYDELLLQGKGSTEDALLAGVLIENKVMVDTVDAILGTDEPDIRRAYGTLLRDSEEHLQAFLTQIKALEGAWGPRF